VREGKRANRGGGNRPSSNFEGIWKEYSEKGPREVGGRHTAGIAAFRGERKKGDKNPTEKRKNGSGGAKRKETSSA